MRKFSFYALVILIAAGTASAEISIPQGKGFESLDIPKADSFVVSGRIEASYADEGMTGAVAMQTFGMVLAEGTYEIDTLRQVLIGAPSGSMVTSDSAGLRHRSRMEVAALGSNTITLCERHYDAQGRAVLEIDSTSETLDFAIGSDSVSSDTLRWTWTHPGCADDQEGDTLRIWSVDGQGRCATAEVRKVTGATSVPTGLVDKFVWQGSALAGALRLQGTDTLLREVFTVDGQGNVTEQVSYVKVDGVWSLVERDSYEYVEGRLDAVKLNGYEGGVAVHLIQFQSASRKTGIRPIARSARSWIAARRDRNAVSFENASTEIVAIELLDAQGRRLDALTVPAGSRSTWNSAPNGTVFWRARTSFGEVSGMLPLIR